MNLGLWFDFNFGVEFERFLKDSCLGEECGFCVGFDLDFENCFFAGFPAIVELIFFIVEELLLLII